MFAPKVQGALRAAVGVNHMMSNVPLALNQQFQQGCSIAQQAMLMEQAGNLFGAAQLYDQSIAVIGMSMSMAGQFGMPVPDNVFFSYGVCQFNAARVKASAGWAQLAPVHLANSLQALNQAIMLRSDVSVYHSAAGVVLLAQGNVVEATMAFQRAVQLNPADAWSHWMLASLYQSQGNAVASNQAFAFAAQVQPNLPPPIQHPVQADSSSATGRASQKDWVGLVNNALTLGNTLAGFFQQSGSDQTGGGAGQPYPGWGQNNWG